MSGGLLKLKKFVAELVIDCSFFERNDKYRLVYRCRTRREFTAVRRKDLENARKKLKDLEEDSRSVLIESHLYQKI